MVWALVALVVAIVLAKPASGATSNSGADMSYAGFTIAELSRTSSGVYNVPPADVLPALEETAARLRLTVQAWPGVKVTSVYRSKEVTAAIWPYYPRQPPSWDWHQKGHAADLSGVDLDELYDWVRASGLWNGADTQLERAANHVHAAWA